MLTGNGKASDKEVRLSTKAYDPILAAHVGFQVLSRQCAYGLAKSLLTPKRTSERALAKGRS
jgi:hypothetical protein